MSTKIHSYDKVVYFLQGGGALGSYQVGVCQALLEYGCTPDWVVGTSIGAINAAIIAGNKPEHRIKKLEKFWNVITSIAPTIPFLIQNYYTREIQNYWSAQLSLFFGQPGFFLPRLINPWAHYSSSPELLSFYDTSELRETLLEIIDFDLINTKKNIRITLGAVKVETGETVRFDNAHQKIHVEHIMASAALPPGFPAIKIDDEYYWDGGLSSNTPFSVILEEKIPEKLLCFIVNLFSYKKHIPTSLMDVMKCKKELEYASRHMELLHHFLELHYLQHIIGRLAKTELDNNDIKQALKKISDAGHPTALNIIRFHYRDQPSDLWSKDFDFSYQSIRDHWRCGYNDAETALKKDTWINRVIDDSKGAVIQEF